MDSSKGTIEPGALTHSKSFRSWIRLKIREQGNMDMKESNTRRVFPKIRVFPPKWMVYNGKPY